MLLLGFLKLYLGSWLVTVVYKILTFWLVWWFWILPIVSKNCWYLYAFYTCFGFGFCVFKRYFLRFWSWVLKKVSMMGTWSAHEKNMHFWKNVRETRTKKNKFLISLKKRFSFFSLYLVMHLNIKISVKVPSLWNLNAWKKNPKYLDNVLMDLYGTYRKKVGSKISRIFPVFSREIA